VGSDADIVLWDPEMERKLTHADLQDGADYTPYEGLRLKGWPVLTMVRGVVVAQDGALVGPRGHGTYLPRARSQYATWPAA
jgi:dihydropyrimidinase